MVRAWYLDQKDTNLRDDCQGSCPTFVDIEELQRKTGVLYWQFAADHHKTNETFQRLRQQRGYTYEDEITVSKHTLPDYDAKVKKFLEEHLHTDEEIRYVLEGRGFFDVRDFNDEWIRVEVVKDDLIILPAGIYHRFCPDLDDYIHVKRYFVGEPVWTPFPRPADEKPARIHYVEFMQQVKPEQS